MSSSGTFFSFWLARVRDSEKARSSSSKLNVAAKDGTQGWGRKFTSPRPSGNTGMLRARNDKLETIKKKGVFRRPIYRAKIYRTYCSRPRCGCIRILDTFRYLACCRRQCSCCPTGSRLRLCGLCALRNRGFLDLGGCR